MFTRERIIEAAQRAGMDEAAIRRLLAELPAQQSNALTIICNDGLHPIPKEQLPGLVFSATTGNVADQTPVRSTARARRQAFWRAGGHRRRMRTWRCAKR